MDAVSKEIDNANQNVSKNEGVTATHDNDIMNPPSKESNSNVEPDNSVGGNMNIGNKGSHQNWDTFSLKGDEILHGESHKSADGSVTKDATISGKDFSIKLASEGKHPDNQLENKMEDLNVVDNVNINIKPVENIEDKILNQETADNKGVEGKIVVNIDNKTQDQKVESNLNLNIGTVINNDPRTEDKNLGLSDVINVKDKKLVVNEDDDVKDKTTVPSDDKTEKQNSLLNKTAVIEGIKEKATLTEDNKSHERKEADKEEKTEKLHEDETLFNKFVESMDNIKEITTIISDDKKTISEDKTKHHQLVVKEDKTPVHETVGTKEKGINEHNESLVTNTIAPEKDVLSKKEASSIEEADAIEVIEEVCLKKDIKGTGYDDGLIEEWRKIEDNKSHPKPTDDPLAGIRDSVKEKELLDILNDIEEIQLVTENNEDKAKKEKDIVKNVVKESKQDASEAKESDQLEIQGKALLPSKVEEKAMKPLEENKNAGIVKDKEAVEHSNIKKTPKTEENIMEVLEIEGKVIEARTEKMETVPLQSENLPEGGVPMDIDASSVPIKKVDEQGKPSSGKKKHGKNKETKPNKPNEKQSSSESTLKSTETGSTPKSKEKESKAKGSTPKSKYKEATPKSKDKESTLKSKDKESTPKSKDKESTPKSKDKESTPKSKDKESTPKSEKGSTPKTREKRSIKEEDKDAALKRQMKHHHREIVTAVRKLLPEEGHDSGVDENTQSKEGVSKGTDKEGKVPPKKRQPRSVDPSPLKRTPQSTASSERKLPMNKVEVGKSASPNIKNVRSKIGSLDNATYRPKGGNIKIESKKLDFSKASSRITAKNDTYVPGGGDKKIETQKLKWSASSKVGSMEKKDHKPGGGNKKIESQKLDFKERAHSKVGSKENMKHKAGGGDVEIHSEPLAFKEKASSKVGSLDNVKHKAGGGEKKIFDDKDYIRQIQTASGSASPCKTPTSKTSSGRASGAISPATTGTNSPGPQEVNDVVVAEESPQSPKEE